LICWLLLSLAEEGLPHTVLAVLFVVKKQPQPRPRPSTSTTIMGDSDSSLSSAPSTDDEMPVNMESTKLKATPQKKKQQGKILSFFKQKDRSPSPRRKKREPSPEHEYGPQDNPGIAVRTGRVGRVLSRRDASHYAVDHYVRARLTFWCAVHCHVPLAIRRSFPSWRAACRTPGHRGGCPRGDAVVDCRRPALRPARLGAQSQEACRVSTAPLSLDHTICMVA
jgi:hypothetical protein